MQPWSGLPNTKGGVSDLSMQETVAPKKKKMVTYRAYSTVQSRPYPLRAMCLYTPLGQIDK